MIPVVVLVGRPNVGKSTLFNRFTGSVDALVADFPGLTRDRQYGQASFENKPFIVVDTGGIGVEDKAVDALMAKQSAYAIKEADIVLFLVDGRSGLTGIDETIAQELRKHNKPIYLVINKTEGLNAALVSPEFQSLGFKVVHAISAAHGSGMQALLQTVSANFPEKQSLPQDENTIKITFVGRPNVGKSTLVNRMLGEERVVVYDHPGTTRDSISIPFVRDNINYTLIDTAGVRRRARVHEKIEKFSVIKTLQSIKESHVCLLILDAREGVTEQDKHLLGFIIEAGKALVLVVNKWDGLELDQKEHIRSELTRQLTFIKFAKTRCISALYGSGVGNLFQDIQAAYTAAFASLSTPKLTRLLEELVSQHPPPLVKGRRIKLRYAHAGGQNPPIIIVHGNQVASLPASYKRYLMNGFVSHLGLVGTPLKIEFKSGENPFKDKKNVLTERQVKRKRRLMKHVKRG